MEEKKIRVLSDEELKVITGGDGWTFENGQWHFTGADGTTPNGWINNIPGWEGQWFFFDCAGGLVYDKAPK